MPRNRTLMAIAQAGLKVFETNELEERVAALEAALKLEQDSSLGSGVDREEGA